MKKTIKIVLLLLVVVTISCKKKDSDDPSDNNSAADDSYIKAYINGTFINADYGEPGSALVENNYDPGDDRAQFIRFVKSTGERWSFYFDYIDFDTIHYPKTLHYGGPSGLPKTDVTYNNGNYGAQGNFGCLNLDPEDFSVTLTSWSNNVIQGTFEGQLEKEDSLITVTNGEFKIKMVTF